MAKSALKSKLIDRFSIPLVFALTIAFIHFAVWAVANRALPLMDAPPIVSGFAYSGFQLNQSPLEKKYPSTEDLQRDLELLQPYSDRIRTYGSLENPQVVALANDLGIRVTAGAWLDRKSTRLNSSH